MRALMELSGLETAVTVASACRLLGLTWVGVRMLRLARRTHGAPERLLGFSFLTFSTLGVPLLTLAGYGASRLAFANVPLIVLALALLDLGATLFAAFVWRVFRPEDPGGRLVVGAAALALLLHVALAAVGLASAPRDLAPATAIGRAEWILTAVMSAIFVWGTAESLAYWVRLRKQSALGLASATSARRMLLFAVGCASQVCMMGFTALAALRGTNPLADPLPALGIAVSSLATGAAFALAFGFGHGRTAEASA